MGGTICTSLPVASCLTHILTFPASMRVKTTYFPSGEIEVLPSIGTPFTRPPLVSFVIFMERATVGFVGAEYLIQMKIAALLSSETPITISSAPVLWRLISLTMYSALDVGRKESAETV